MSLKTKLNDIKTAVESSVPSYTFKIDTEAYPHDKEVEVLFLDLTKTYRELGYPIYSGQIGFIFYSAWSDSYQDMLDAIESLGNALEVLNISGVIVGDDSADIATFSSPFVSIDPETDTVLRSIQVSFPVEVQP